MAQNNILELKMKICTALLLTFVLAGVQGFSEEQKKALKIYQNDCSASSQADPELIQRARSDDFGFEDDNTKSYVLCIFQKIGLLDKDGNFRKEVALAKLSEDKRPAAGKAIDACLEKYKQPNQSVQQFAWNTLKCYQKLLPGSPII